MMEDELLGGQRRQKMNPDSEIKGMDSMTRAMYEPQMVEEQTEELSPAMDPHETWTRIRVKDGVEFSYRPDAIGSMEGRMRQLVSMIRKFLKQN